MIINDSTTFIDPFADLFLGKTRPFTNYIYDIHLELTNLMFANVICPSAIGEKLADLGFWYSHPHRVESFINTVAFGFDQLFLF